jgi:hypothetical protein
MELRINLLFLGLTVVCATALSATEPVAALDPGACSTRKLAELEDAFAQDPSKPEVALHLVEAYLERHRPELAITVFRASAAALHASPILNHRLSQAHEAEGNVRLALEAAERAVVRCSERLEIAGQDDPLACDARLAVVLDIHVAALTRLDAWGVTDPASDPRTRLAYDTAMRRARIAMIIR